jgi:3-isopropylmalate dehydrogenase
MQAKIAVLGGDGIGPEVVAEGEKVLERIAQRFGHHLAFFPAAVGGSAYDQFGCGLPAETIAVCEECDAILFGAVGGPQWDHLRDVFRPEAGLLELRRRFDLFANLRPVRLYPPLCRASTIKEEVIAGVDLVVIRELTGGIYFGQPSKRWEADGVRWAIDTLIYSAPEIERVLRVGFDLARQRRKRLASVDKANVLSSSRLWRDVAVEVARDYPDVICEHVLVDACAMHLIRQPARFDVIVTENMFGDILTDEASMLTGSMGMMPSASLGIVPNAGYRRGLYEPIHGSAPDIAGKGIANPLATILSAAMMLRYSFSLNAEAAVIETAVEEVLEEGYRTADIAEQGAKALSTAEMGDLVATKVAG